MAVICPTITARNPHTYRTQMERIASLSHRVHIDLMDGVFTAHKSVNIDEVWWPVGVSADLHLMYKSPLGFIKEIIRLKPDLVIVHAEADGNFIELSDILKENEIKVGLALLQKTPVTQIEPVLDIVDHVLIFSGSLGNFGGEENPALLEKVRALKVINPNIEIGWDGGVNNLNAESLINSGVDVLDIGGYIHRAENPDQAYAKLEGIARKTNNE